MTPLQVPRSTVQQVLPEPGSRPGRKPHTSATSSSEPSLTEGEGKTSEVPDPFSCIRQHGVNSELRCNSQKLAQVLHLLSHQRNFISKHTFFWVWSQEERVIIKHGSDTVNICNCPLADSRGEGRTWRGTGCLQAEVTQPVCGLGGHTRKRKWVLVGPGPLPRRRGLVSVPHWTSAATREAAGMCSLSFTGPLCKKIKKSKWIKLYRNIK